MTALAGAVLTGGSSRRMGRDKALVPVEGVPMARRAADALIGAGVGPVVAVGGDAAGLAAIGLTVIGDRWPGEGPLGGLLTALGWSPTPRIVVTAGDVPWLDPATVEALSNAETGDAAVTMAFTDRLQPLCAIWTVAEVVGPLEAAFAAGERAVRHAVRGLRIRRVELGDPGPLRDVDTPGDLPSA